MLKLTGEMIYYDKEGVPHWKSIYKTSAVILGHTHFPFGCVRNRDCREFNVSRTLASIEHHRRAVESEFA